jgi:pyrimidine deaminase RibD-like protein
VTQPARPDADRRWLLEAISLSRRCPPSQSAYSVGAVLVAADGTVLSTGYSRETAPAEHAEEAALRKLGVAAAAARPELAAATLYSSLEPCAVRASRPMPCADLIIASGIRRVVIAWTEPPVLAPGGGDARLRAAGVEVVEVPELAMLAREVNAHLLDRGAAAQPWDTA